jgi:hypothetical protein
MKRKVSIIAAATAGLFLLSVPTFAQNVHTVFKKGITSSGGYGAATNKFTTIRGKFANLSGIYGGWYINHRFMIGAAGAAVTNNLRVPTEFSTDPTNDMSYEYGQFGLMTEYVFNSDKAIHFSVSLFSGAGFTIQYQRYGWDDDFGDNVRDENWFFVAEPGVQVEVNLFKWMRCSPGVSYRKSFGSDGSGMRDKDVSNVSYNATLKFGKF